jgi:phosphate transport system permease protein
MCVYTASVFSVGVLVAIVVYICIKGIPHLSLSLFSFEYNSTNVSLFPALVNTILMTALSLLIAVPVGVFSAVYLAEYARRGTGRSRSSA